MEEEEKHSEHSRASATYLTLRPTRAQPYSFPIRNPPQASPLIYRKKLRLEIRRKQNKTKFLLCMIDMRCNKFMTQRQNSIVLHCALSDLFYKSCKFVSTVVLLEVTLKLIKWLKLIKRDVNARASLSLTSIRLNQKYASAFNLCQFLTHVNLSHL